MRDLADPALANWVHHVLHILPQGRTQWFNTTQKNDDAEEEEEDEQEIQDDAEPEGNIYTAVLRFLKNLFLR